MKTVLAALLAGLVFGTGLALSGMTDPAVVQGFLDFAGAWNPALAFVMGGALLVTFFGYRLVFGRKPPLFAKQFHLPVASEIDMALIAGAVLFGLGWGLSGYCPGPAVASLSSGNAGVLVFAAAMAAGMALAGVARARTGR